VRRLLIGILLSCVIRGVAADALFYQPQTGDAVVEPDQWAEIWRQCKAHGFDRVIVQWTRYGDEDFGGDHGWLRNALRQARQAGLGLVLGLYQDPDYFSRLNDLSGLSRYWKELFDQTLLQQRLLLSEGVVADAWYLPAELSDRTFNDHDRRKDLLEQLNGLMQHLQQPLQLSAYSTGQLAPAANARWLDELHSVGVMVWWQDGVGVAELPALVRTAYVQALSCETGIVSEAFRRTSVDDEPFTAVPADPQRHSSCHPSAVFSLRYMPWGAALPSASR
jgi:hypothetical protein